MSDLQAILEAVYAITDRPDLVGLTTLAVQKATIKEHTQYDFTRDLVLSSSITLTDTSPASNRYTVQITGNTALVRVRKVLYILENVGSVQVLTSFEGTNGQIVFKEVSNSDIFDPYGMERQNYFARLGDTINIVANRAVAAVRVKYYQLPDTATVTYQSWIADNYPYVIADHAALEVFRAIGKKDEEKIYLAKLGDNRTDILRGEVTEVD